LTPLEELSRLLSGQSRAIVIASKDVDLGSAQDANDVFVLQMPHGSLAAGGRGGGLGERRVIKVFLFRCSHGSWDKVYETEDEAKLSEFEIPFHVARIPIRLADGTESMGYGVVEPELVGQMLAKAGRASPP